MRCSPMTRPWWPWSPRRAHAAYPTEPGTARPAHRPCGWRGGKGRLVSARAARGLLSDRWARYRLLHCITLAETTDTKTPSGKCTCLICDLVDTVRLEFVATYVLFITH